MISEYSQNTIDSFLSIYDPKGSRNNYISAVKTLIRVISKDDIRKLTFEDYKSTTGNTSQDGYRTSFFKYLYAFDILENTKGFETLCIKEATKNYFLNKIAGTQNAKKEKKQYKPTLTLEQIGRIEKLTYISGTDDLDMLRLTFSWYMLFHTECKVDELRKYIDSKDYRNGQITSKLGNIYEIPDHFAPILERFASRESHTGSSELSVYITKLGDCINIEGLTPMMIKNARKENMLICMNCGEQYLNIIENWTSVNGRVVCLSCAEILKETLNV